MFGLWNGLMTEETQTLIQLCVLLPAGLAAVFVLFKRGCLSAQSLANRPVKQTGLLAVDLLIGLMVLIFGMMLTSVVAGMIPTDTQNTRLEAGMQLVHQLCTFGPLIAYITARLRVSDHHLGDIGLSLCDPPHWKMGMWATVLGIPILFALSTLVAFASNLMGFQTEEIAHKMLITISQTKDVVTLGLLLISAIVFAPLFEEFIFRGFLHQSMRDVISPGKPWMSIAICSFIFAGIHISAAQWQAMPALFILGGILGWMYEKSASLWPCIILHACFNALNIAIVLLFM
jgi:membrane protease YdiL (CAAX protease family)